MNYLRDYYLRRVNRPCIDLIFNPKEIIKKCVDFNLESHLIIIENEKTFDRVHRDKLWDIIKKRKYGIYLISDAQNCCLNTEIITVTIKKIMVLQETRK